MNKINVWQIVPFVLPVLSYIFGKSKNKLSVPKPIGDLMKDDEVMKVIIQGVQSAADLSDKSDDEKREYVRSWAKSELFKLLGEWLPDSAVNFLIEKIIVGQKAS